MNLLNQKWYRNLFLTRTFVKSDDIWIDKKNYSTGKITEVDGKWNSQVFCDCGNELMHSNSFVQERQVSTNYIFDYKCTSCGNIQYFNPDIIPGLLPCDINGNPKN